MYGGWIGSGLCQFNENEKNNLKLLSGTDIRINKNPDRLL
jgi:hypothetical protein